MGRSQISHYCSNVTTPSVQKSIYFSIQPNESYPDELRKAWFYTNGTFKGKFEEVIGKGAEGVIIKGQWMKKRAAFKFVEIDNLKVQELATNGFRDLKKRLTEMYELQFIDGSHIVATFGHLR